MGFLNRLLNKKRRIDLYSEEQEQAIRELQEEVELMEGSVQGQIENEIMVGPSYSSSTISPAASGSKVVAKVGLNKLGMPYFESLEKRLDIEEEEFFKKEEFDIEE